MIKDLFFFMLLGTKHYEWIHNALLSYVYNNLNLGVHIVLLTDTRTPLFHLSLPIPTLRVRQ